MENFADELLISLLKDLDEISTTPESISAGDLLESIDEELAQYIQILLTDNAEAVALPQASEDVLDDSLMEIIQQLLHETPTQAQVLKSIEVQMNELHQAIIELRQEVLCITPKTSQTSPALQEVSEKINLASFPAIQLSKLYLPTKDTVLYHYKLSHTA